MDKKPLRIIVLKKNYLLKLKEWFYQQHQKTSKRLNHYINHIKAPTPKRKGKYTLCATEKRNSFILETPICKTSRNIKTQIEGRIIYPDPQESKINRATSPLKTKTQQIIGVEKSYGINN